MPKLSPDAKMAAEDVPSATEARRRDALRALGLVGTRPSPGFDRIVETARDLFAAPIAYVSLIEAEQEWYKASVGIDARVAPRREGFCDHVIRSDAVTVIEDTASDARFRDLPPVRDGIRFYAGAPLILAGGARIGALAVLDRTPRRFDATDRALLAELARAAVADIESGPAHDVASAAETDDPEGERFRALASGDACIVWRADADGRVTELALSGAFAKRAAGDLLGFGWLDLVDPRDRKAALRCGRRAERRATHVESTRRLLDGDGRPRWARIRAVPLFDEGGRVREWVGECVDIHVRTLTEHARRREAERLRLALHAGRMVTWEFDPDTRSVVHSDTVTAVLGLPGGDYSAFRERIHPDDRSQFEAAYRPGGPMSEEAIRYFHPDGRMLWLSSRGIAMADAEGRQRIIGVTFDITERKEAEERVLRAASRDGLTGLDNRAAFQRALETALPRALDLGESRALILVDIDDFKDINDSAGHDVGDALLREAGDRLRRIGGRGAAVARLGADEFALLVPTPESAASGMAQADEIVEALRRPMEHGGRAFACRASVGVAMFPEHAISAAELMRGADLALSAAKDRGRNRACAFEDTMRTAMEARIAVLDEIREALREDAIVPYYQPKVDLATGAITGFEALARWNHPVRGLLTPGAFAGAFENPEIAIGIGERMVTRVAADLARWLGQGLEPGTVAVNFSAAEFGRADLPEAVFARLDAAGVPRWRLGVEVTETVFLGARATAVGEILARFAKAGLRIALDDFGTGYASLTHLKQFPVDDIKIDRSFVRDLEHDSGDAAIVGAVIGLGRALGLRVVAEGVEVVGQQEALRAMGCDEAQGFLIAKPMPASQVPWFLHEDLKTRAARAEQTAARAPRARAG